MPEGKAPHFPQQPVARQNDDGSLELECFLDASPQPDIKWFYDNKEVKPDSRFQFKLDSKGNDSYSAILQIKWPLPLLELTLVPFFHDEHKGCSAVFLLATDSKRIVFFFEELREEVSPSGQRVSCAAFDVASGLAIVASLVWPT
ncbi:hypothetical protein RB195_023980 [Necator americanus]|uniref:Immunoglobulin I-set domain-containing protein n=1 Tax=Necator americanus TaxID=51031 RepID=A0ABR1ELC1_NECAM